MKTNKKLPHRFRKPLLIFGGLLVLLLISAQVAFDIYTYRSSGDTTTITQLIIAAVENLHKPAVVDAKTGNLYLPDAKVFLPSSSNNFDEIMYNYDSAGKVIGITSKLLLSQAETKLWSAPSGQYDSGKQLNNVFAQVPNLQACSRGVEVYLTAPKNLDSELQAAGSKVLANGTTARFYRTKACDSYHLPELLDQVKQLQSY